MGEIIVREVGHGTMQTSITFRTSAIPNCELRRTLSDYLALERVRGIRRVLVTRFAAIAAIAGSAMIIAHLFTPITRIVTVGLCLVPALGAWIAEIVIAYRLLRRIKRSPGIYTTSRLSDRSGKGRAAA